MFFEEYRRLFLMSRYIGIIGSVLLIGLIFQELIALQYAVSIYEGPSLSNTIWWQAFRSFAFGGSLIATLAVRTVILFRGTNSEGRLFVSTWLLPAGLFLAYAFSIEPSSTFVCDERGICRGIYSTQPTDWIAMPALLFFPASLIRFLTIAAPALFNVSLRLK